MKSVAIHPRVMIDALWPNVGMARDLVLVVGGSLLIALSAQLAIPLPFSPVPITGQTFAVLLIAALFGSKRGVATVVTYLALGVVGLPVFAGGAAGAARLVGPTAGYLLGWLPAAYLVGLLSERGWDRSAWSTALAMMLGNLVIYAVGAFWLARFVPSGAVIETGVLPFLAGDAVKIALATVLLPAAWKLIGRREGNGA